MISQHKLRALHAAYSKHTWLRLSPTNCIYVCLCGAAQLGRTWSPIYRPLSVRDFNGRAHSFNMARIVQSFGDRAPRRVRLLGQWAKRNQVCGGTGNTAADIAAALTCGLRVKAKEAKT